MAFETAFSMDTSSIKYGPGVTREVGWDIEEQGARRVMVVTDKYNHWLNTISMLCSLIRPV
jgi:hydroxyacid-oxoacid transhydrogenase